MKKALFCKISIAALSIVIIMCITILIFKINPAKKARCIALVSNKSFLDIALKTIDQIRSMGNYHDDILLIIGDDLEIHDVHDRNKSIIVRKYPNINLSKIHAFHKRHPFRSPFNAHISKPFQFHKMYLFHTDMKDWKTVLYIDAGMTIHKDIHPMFNIPHEGVLVAHSDMYLSGPENVYRNQFALEVDHHVASDIQKKFDLSGDYFQTTMMLYDTDIIQANTLSDLIFLANEYPIARLNDQPIMNLYFNGIYKLWRQIPLGYYDYFYREPEKYDYIMTKR